MQERICSPKRDSFPGPDPFVPEVLLSELII